MRGQMEEHRRNPSCASCHKLMDPLGFALEQFDAVGAWRVRDAGGRIDASVELADGATISGPAALRRKILERPELFVTTVTEKLLTYALGRGLTANDMPAVRAIVRASALQNYRFSSLILGVVKSAPFLMRAKPRSGRPAGVRRRVTMYLTRMAIPRRTFLRGAGATLALPLLDAMVPAATALAQTPARPIKRFGSVYVPHGAIMNQWTPATTGANFDFSPILKPLEPFRDHLVVTSGLGSTSSEGLHAPGPICFLSGVKGKKTEGDDIYNGITIDQALAKEIGQTTPFPSIEVATEDFTGFIGACDGGWSCAYLNTISWQTATNPLPMETNPRVVFERLFGGTGSAAQREARRRVGRSVLDSLASEVTQLRTKLEGRDRSRLDDYLQNIREIERRIEQAERTARADVTVPDAPFGAPAEFEAHASLMFDLLAIAWQADITRVFSFMMARELSQRSYPELGAPDPHHAMSHHRNDPLIMARNARVQTYHYSLFANFVEKLKATPDGDGSLLDHSMLMYGSGMSNSNLHAHKSLPIVVVGGRQAGVNGNRHVASPENTPVANLLLAFGQKFGLEMESFGDSSGAVDL